MLPAKVSMRKSSDTRTNAHPVTYEYCNETAAFLQRLSLTHFLSNIEIAQGITKNEH